MKQRALSVDTPDIEPKKKKPSLSISELMFLEPPLTIAIRMKMPLWEISFESSVTFRNFVYKLCTNSFLQLHAKNNRTMYATFHPCIEFSSEILI